MDDKLITIAEYGSSFDARMTKMNLESNGIKAVIVGEELLCIVPKAGIPNIQVKVLACDAERSTQIINAQEHDSINHMESELEDSSE